MTGELRGQASSATTRTVAPIIVASPDRRKPATSPPAISGKTAGPALRRCHARRFPASGVGTFRVHYSGERKDGATMLRFLVRFAGLLVFAASFIVLVSDGVRSLAANRVLTTPLGQTWFDLDSSSLNLAQALVQRYIHPAVWDPAIQTILQWPTFLVGGVTGIALMIVGSRRST
jgi:hypothetical protein